MRLAEHTTTTAAAALPDAEVGLLPTGATEQHGPALPLGTDATVATELARSLDREDAVVLPTVPVGASAHHRQFDGTLYVEPETLEWYVRETLASLAEDDLRKAVVVNGHGGNTDAIRRAARGVRDEGIAFAAPWNWFGALPDDVEAAFEGSSGHAGALETGVMLHLAEDLVRGDALEAAEAGAAASWGRDVAGADVGFDAADFSESGVVGAPTEATREAGERAFEAASDRLDALVDWLAARDFEDLLPEPHRRARATE